MRLVANHLPADSLDHRLKQGAEHVATKLRPNLPAHNREAVLLPHAVGKSIPLVEIVNQFGEGHGGLRRHADRIASMNRDASFAR
jgi:hypothetical protein